MHHEYSASMTGTNNINQLDTTQPSTSPPTQLDETCESIETNEANEILNETNYVTKNIIHIPELTSPDGTD